MVPFSFFFSSELEQIQMNHINPPLLQGRWRKIRRAKGTKEKKNSTGCQRTPERLYFGANPSLFSFFIIIIFPL